MLGAKAQTSNTKADGSNQTVAHGSSASKEDGHLSTSTGAVVVKRPSEVLARLKSSVALTPRLEKNVTEAS